jgi:hypothetical protein
MGMPPVEAAQVRLTRLLEAGVAVTLSGAKGGPSVVAEAAADIGEALPPESLACTS